MSSHVKNHEDIKKGKYLRMILGLGDQRLDETQLPSLADAGSILSLFLTDPNTKTQVKDRESQWRTLALKWLTYGSIQWDDESPMGTDGPTSCYKRVEQTVQFFVRAIRTFRERAHESKQDIHPCPPPTDPCSPERILVDAFWFVATQLYRESLPSSTAGPPHPVGDTSPKNLTDVQSKNAAAGPYASFCSIVNGIVMGLETPPSNNSTSHDTTITTNIPLSLLLAGMEPVHLASASLLTDSTSLPYLSRSPITRDYFTKQFSKYITNMYYKQTHSTLMIAEETEGYSKLLHLLVGLPFSIQNSQYAEKGLIEGDESNGLQRMKTMLRGITLEMIGTFQLAPIRVLDLTLDILESHLLSLDLEGLERISWAHQMNYSPNKVIAMHLLMDIIQMYPCSNVAHLLGFKLWSYASPSDTSYDSSTSSGDGLVDAQKSGNKLPTVTSSSSLKADGVEGKDRVSNEKTKTAPQSLYITCALLVSHGIQVLEHLLPHMHVDLSSVQSVYDKKRKDDIARIRKIISLNSSLGSTTKTEASESSMGEEALKKETVSIKQELEDSDGVMSTSLGVNHQFFDLLLACLQANLPWDDVTSLFEPFMSEANSSGRAMDEVLEACCGIYPQIGTGLCCYIDGMLSDLYAERISNKSKMVQVRQLLVDETDDEKSLTINFSGTVVSTSLSRRNKLCVQSTLMDVSKALFRPLRCVVINGSIAHHPLLYSKILRLVHSYLTQGVATEVAFDQDTSYLFESFLVPSISLFPFNTALSAELWSVLSAISSYPIRYTLYGSIRSSGLEKEALTKMGARKPLQQIESEVESGREVRYRLRRVSMENVREMGRQIAKVANTNPLVVFTAILKQIESYDNLISLMVDTFQFLTSYSLDVLGYCLLTFLGGGDAKFGRTKTKDDGISTAQWLSSLATFIGAFYRKFPDVEVHGILSHMVKKISEGSVVELCVLQSLLKTAGGYGFADCSSIASLSQLQLEGRCGSLELRRETSDFGVIEKYDLNSSSKIRTALQSTDFGTIFLILLCQIRYKLFNMKMTKIKLIGNALDTCQRTTFLLLTFITESLEEGDNNGDSLVTKYAMSLPSPQDLLEFYGLEPVAIWSLHRPIFRFSLTANSATFLSSTINYDTFQNMVSDHFKQAISPILYHIFFVLSIYDITYPEERYMLEIDRLNREIDRLTKLQKGGKEAQGTISAMTQAAAAAGVTGKELRDASLFTKAHELDLERLKRTVHKLSVDMARQKAHNEMIIALLESEKNELVVNLAQSTDVCRGIQAYMSECVSPRCRLSPDDALFCSRFSSLLHNLGTPNFYTLFFYDTVIGSLERIIYGLTEDEASNFAIFLQDSWKCISAYRFDANAYETSLQGKIGSTWPMDNEIKFITYSDFIEIYKRWHDSVAIVLLGALNAAEYMYCRAALIILSRLVTVFPTNARTGRKIMKALLRFQATDFAMQDIKAMAQGYKSQLLKARDEGLWKEEKAAYSQGTLGEPDDKQKSLVADVEMQDVTAECKDLNGRSANGHVAVPNNNNVLTETESKHPDEVIVVHEDKSSDALVESSNATEPTANLNERAKGQLDSLSQEGNAARPDSREHDDGIRAVNGGNLNHASNDTQANNRKDDGPTLGTRWEKADESRGSKRKGSYHTANEPQRRSDGRSNRGQHYHRRSY